jgi:hypothetical protein
LKVRQNFDENWEGSVCGSWMMQRMIYERQKANNREEWTFVMYEDEVHKGHEEQ